jgi:hypothetical protein
MRSWLLFLWLVFPGIAFSATLSGSIVNSAATVDLPSVGTLDWARWPGYKHKSNLISDLVVTGYTRPYTTDPRLIGDRSAVRVLGVGGQVDFTVRASTVERTLIYYIGGWNSTGELTVSLPGATTYRTTVRSSNNYSRVLTVKFRADTEGALLRVRFRQTAGSIGSIRVQAAALRGTVTSPTPPPVNTGSAILTWVPPSQNTDGSPLIDLAGYKVYWGPAQGNYPNSVTISNGGITGHTVNNLTQGQWYFVVTSVSSSGRESAFSNVATKVIP